MADTTEEVSRPRPGRRDDDERTLGLAILWSAEPGRVGEILFVTSRSVLGRGREVEQDAKRLTPVRQRPGENEPRAPFARSTLSREQLLVEPLDDGLTLRRIGRRALLDARGNAVDSIATRPGDVVEIEDELVLMTVERPRVLPRTPAGLEVPRPEFGRADPLGVVGESEAAWKLRAAVAFLAARSAHVLVLSPSGCGKELVARGIHALSSRSRRTMVCRNAATFAETLVDAELFGTAANFPNAGMPERIGLVGEAEGSTLFFDEIGDMPEALQTRLLRLLDPGADYQRLGDPRRRTAQFRFIGATNRPLDMLRLDVAARFKLQLTIPGLDERREDVPLIAAELVRQIATTDAAAARFCGPEPALSPSFVRLLATWPFAAHVRELEALLWRAITSTSGERLEAPDLGTARDAAHRTQTIRPDELTKEEIAAALERSQGVRERAWRELGLANRHVLKRLLKKYGLSSED